MSSLQAYPDGNFSKLTATGKSALNGGATVNGSLTVGDTTAGSLTLNKVKVSGFSDKIPNSDLNINDQELLPTQNAVKIYVDNGLSAKAALWGSATQDFQAKALTVTGPLTLQGVEVNQFSKDPNLGTSDQALPTQKAVKTYVDNQLSTKAALNGDSNQDFQAKALTVNGALTVTGDALIGGAHFVPDGKSPNVGSLRFGDGSGWKFHISRFDNGAAWMTFDDHGRVGIGTINPEVALHVNGTIKASEVQIENKLATCGAEKLRIIRGIRSNSPTGEFKVDSQGKGKYKIWFTHPFENPPTVVVQQFGSDDANTRDNAIVWDVCKNHCMVRTGDKNGDGTDRDFCFIAIGW